MKYSYSFEEYDELPMCAKAIVKREYRNNYNSYVRKDSNRSKEIEKVVYKYFPNGFRPSDDEQFFIF